MHANWNLGIENTLLRGYLSEQCVIQGLETMHQNDTKKIKHCLFLKKKGYLQINGRKNKIKITYLYPFSNLRTGGLYFVTIKPKFDLDIKAN